MQGQSPYVVNAGLYYNNYETGLQVNASYNVLGARIYAVGDNIGNRNQYEMPRNQIDLTVSKTFGLNWEVKFGIQDVLNQRYRLTQDTNRDKKINSDDDKIQTFRTGQYISLGVTYKLF
jgi:outer membrane receptor protein involved in Fe transport